MKKKKQLHLANERTYLAWLRTSLSITAIGIAINQLMSNASAHIVGYVFVILGGIFLGVATFRYFRTMSLLIEVISFQSFFVFLKKKQNKTKLKKQTFSFFQKG